MSLRLLLRGVQMLVGAALLWVAILAMLLPGTAEAQSTTASIKDAGATTRNTVVVRPGDSLWAITQERLGPNATLQQIDRGVERIYALNQERIGPNPNLIFPGQELLVPPEGQPAAARQRVADRSSELQLTPSRNSGVSGTATLTDVEGGVKVELSMRGLPEAGVEHINHIHGGGTCADDQAGRTAPVTIPLNNVVAKEDGTGSATTTIKGVTQAQLFGKDKARYILLHAKTEKGQGVPPGISCADLVPRLGSGTFETLPVSGAQFPPVVPSVKNSTSDLQAEPVAPPALPAREAVPKAGSLRAEGDPLSWPTVASLASSWLLALGIIVLAVCPLAFLVWTLRMQKRLEARMRRLSWAEHYGKNYTRFDPFLGFEDTLRLAGGASGEPEPDPNGSASGAAAPPAANGLARIERFAAARARRSTRLPRPRGGLTTSGVYSPKIRRHLRAASSTQRQRVPGASPRRARRRRRKRR